MTSAAAWQSREVFAILFVAVPMLLFLRLSGATIGDIMRFFSMFALQLQEQWIAKDLTNRAAAERPTPRIERINKIYDVGDAAIRITRQL